MVNIPNFRSQNTDFPKTGLCGLNLKLVYYVFLFLRIDINYLKLFRAYSNKKHLKEKKSM